MEKGVTADEIINLLKMGRIEQATALDHEFERLQLLNGLLNQLQIFNREQRLIS